MPDSKPGHGQRLFSSVEGFSNVDASATPERFAEYLDRVTGFLIEQKRETLKRLQLQPGSAFLDVGCGLGTDVFEAEAIVGPSGRTVGVDASASMIAEARNRAQAVNSRAEFLVSSADRLEFGDRSFDAVHTERVLMHVLEPARAVAELVRVLKPGGRLLCHEPDHQMSAIDASDGALCDRIMRGLNLATANPRIGRQLRALFLGAGLQKVRVELLQGLSTSLAAFRSISFGSTEELVARATALGIATPDEVHALLADLEERDAQGRFLSLAVSIRCVGVLPG